MGIKKNLKTLVNVNALICFVKLLNIFSAAIKLSLCTVCVLNFWTVE